MDFEATTRTKDQNDSESVSKILITCQRPRQVENIQADFSCHEFEQPAIRCQAASDSEPINRNSNIIYWWWQQQQQWQCKCTSSARRTYGGSASANSTNGARFIEQQQQQ